MLKILLWLRVFLGGADDAAAEYHGKAKLKLWNKKSFSFKKSGEDIFFWIEIEFGKLLRTTIQRTNATSSVQQFHLRLRRRTNKNHVSWKES